MGFFITLLIYAALAVLSDLLRPKPDLENAKPNGLGDFNFPTNTEGRAIPIGWGTFEVSGPNVVDYTDLIQQPIKERIKTGLFSSETQILGFRYFLGIQYALCLGEVDELLTIRINDELVLDATGSPITDGQVFDIDSPDLFGGEDLGQGGVVGTMRFFAGSDLQTVSAYLSGRCVRTASISNAGTSYSVDDVLTENGSGTASERATYKVTAVGGGGEVVRIKQIQGGNYSAQSTSPAATTVAPGGGSGATLSLTYGTALQSEGGVTPAYHDLCYIVPDAFPTLYGTSSTIRPPKFVLRRTPNGLVLTGGKEVVAGGANPANVLYEVLTNADWGYGYLAADVDTTSFTTAADLFFTEGNGFSFLLDRVEDLPEMVERVEEQVDALLFQNPLTGKWQLRTVRDDYDIMTVPEVSADANLIDLRTFTKSTWEGTSNQVRTPYADGADDYKQTNGFAQDMAGVRILGVNVSTQKVYGGVKDGTLANALAWRDLRTLAIPLVQCTLVVDRSLYGTIPGDVVALTDEDIGFIRLPIRVKSVDYGDLLNGRIVIEGVQDVFFAAAGVFGDPPATNWVEPSTTVSAFPSDEQLAFEAPRALTLRDPETVDPISDKIYAAARDQGPEATFKIVQRNASGTPSGDFEEVGQSFSFMFVGELQSALSPGSAYPLSTLIVVADPSSQAEINTAFPNATDTNELGNELLSLCLIGDEFILVESAQASGANIQLNNVYRGVLDSVQGDHAAGAKVHLLFVGGKMSVESIPAGNNVDVKLLPRSLSGTLAEGSATTISFTMDDRTRRPYPPASFDLNGVTLDKTNVDLDGSGSGEDVGILVDEIVRRDFRLVNEIDSLLSDAALLASDFPTENTTEVEIDILNGVTVLTSTTGISGTSATMRQLDILAGLGTTSLPSTLTVAVRQSHTFLSVVYKSRYDFALDFTVDSPFVGKFAFGELDQNIVSASFVVVADTVDHVFNLSSSFTVGDVEYRINGGGWLTLISAGGTGPGTIPNASLSASDTIEVRHTSTDTTPQKLLTMTVSGAEEAYGVLIS